MTRAAAQESQRGLRSGNSGLARTAGRVFGFEQLAALGSADGGAVLRARDRFAARAGIRSNPDFWLGAAEACEVSLSLVDRDSWIGLALPPRVASKL